MSHGVLRLTRVQVREVDRVSIERFGVPGIVLMENAARGAADVAWEMMRKRKARVVVVCGGGNNGGDGYAVARHLHNRGAAVRIVDAAVNRLDGDAAINRRIVEAMGIEIVPMDQAAMVLGDQTTALVVDAIFGTGLTRAIEGKHAELIERMNSAGHRTLAIDLPSGMDCDTGMPLGGVCVKAERTATFVAEKEGFAFAAARQWTGKVTVVDIGCPVEAINIAMKL